MRRFLLAVLASTLTVFLATTSHGQAPAPGVHAGDALQRALSGIEARQVPSGILYDRVVPISDLRSHDGSAYLAATTADWRQMYFEMYRASLVTPNRPSLDALEARVQRPGPFEAVPVAVLDLRYDRFRADALDKGALRVESGRAVIVRPDALEGARAFAAAAMIDHTYRGGAMTFAFDRRWYFGANPPAAFEVDFDDGQGFRPVTMGSRVAVAYPSTGTKTVRMSATSSDGTVLRTAFTFRVVSLQAPLPTDTLSVTATIPYNGEYGTGEAYVYLADSHSVLTQPVVMIEGFDIDNNMNWDELYALLNTQNLAEDVRADGYDLVVMNFTDATDYIQKNSFAVENLLEQVQTAIAPTTHYVLVGASMGGLCARYALDYMETNAIPHRVSTYISFDTPHEGANIPLGIQYWLDFFQGNSADAAALLASLDRPAARQMLVYHHTTPPGATGESDPLRTAFDADLASLGDFPSIPRKVAMANGSGTMMNQGFNAGAQIITWNYNNGLINLKGNVWAVPDGSLTQIFEGRLTIFGLGSTENVSVSGTSPYDNAPGGWRDSMAQMDSVTAPYGDIIANYPNHCFIPVVSSLDLATSDLFYDVAADPNLLSITPFDAVYYPTENQPHVQITAENKQWVLDEILGSPTDVRPGGAPGAAALTLEQNTPNPFNPSTIVRYTLPQSERVRITVYDVRGAEVATLFDGVRAAGPGEVRWNGTDAHGSAVGSGVYFCRLDAGGQSRTRKMVLLK